MDIKQFFPDLILNPEDSKRIDDAMDAQERELRGKLNMDSDTRALIAISSVTVILLVDIRSRLNSLEARLGL